MINTDFDFAPLRAYVDNNDEARELISQGSTQGLAELLNDKSISDYGKVAQGKLLLYMISSGIITRLTDPALPDRSKAISLGITTFFNTSGLDYLDFGDLAVRQMITVLVSDGTITETEKDELLSLGSTKISPFEQLYGKNAIATSDLMARFFSTTGE